MSELGESLRELEGRLAELSRELEALKGSLVDWNGCMKKFRESLQEASKYREIKLYNSN